MARGDVVEESHRLPPTSSLPRPLQSNTTTEKRSAVPGQRRRGGVGTLSRSVAEEIQGQRRNGRQQPSQALATCALSCSGARARATLNRATHSLTPLNEVKLFS